MDRRGSVVVGALLNWRVKSEVDGSINEDRIPCSTRMWQARRGKKWTNPLVLPAAGLEAIERGNCHYYIESSILYYWTLQGYITRRPCPRVLPRGHTTQRARWKIFKLSLTVTFWQGYSWDIPRIVQHHLQVAQPEVILGNFELWYWTQCYPIRNRILNSLLLNITCNIE